MEFRPPACLLLLLFISWRTFADSFFFLVYICWFMTRIVHFPFSFFPTHATHSRDTTIQIQQWRKTCPKFVLMFLGYDSFTGTRIAQNLRTKIICNFRLALLISAPCVEKQVLSLQVFHHKEKDFVKAFCSVFCVCGSVTSGLDIRGW